MIKCYEVRENFKPGLSHRLSLESDLEAAKKVCDKNPGSWVIEVTRERIYANPK